MKFQVSGVQASLKSVGVVQSDSTSKLTCENNLMTLTTLLRIKLCTCVILNIMADVRMAGVRERERERKKAVT